MRIIVHSSVFLPTPAKGAGAVEYLVAKLSEGLATRGHDVTLACLEGSTLAENMPGIIPLKIDAKGSAQAREAGLACRIAEAAVEQGWPDVLFDHSLTQMTQRVMDLPAVTMSHGMAPVSPWARNVVFTSEHHGRLHGVKAPVALHNGIDVDEVPFCLAPRRHDYLTWAGRFLPYKRPDVAISVTRQADATIWLYGPATDRQLHDKLLKDSYRADLEGSVTLQGEAQHDELLHMIAGSNALLFTSDETEPAGIVMLEAQAAGTPVLAFDHGANREFTDPGRTAYLAKDGADMVRAVKERFWESIRPEDCRAYVQEHRSIEAMTARAEQLLQRAAAGDRW